MIWLAIISTLSTPIFMSNGWVHAGRSGYQTTFVETRNLRDCLAVIRNAAAMPGQSVGRCVKIAGR